MTSYIVLRNPDREIPLEGRAGASMWVEAGPPVDAVSAEAAIRKAVDGDEDGRFVAIPMRSFKPVKVTVATKRTLTLA